MIHFWFIFEETESLSQHMKLLLLYFNSISQLFLEAYCNVSILLSKSKLWVLIPEMLQNFLNISHLKVLHNIPLESNLSDATVGRKRGSLPLLSDVDKSGFQDMDKEIKKYWHFYLNSSYFLFHVWRHMFLHTTGDTG